MKASSASAPACVRRWDDWCLSGHKATSLPFPLEEHSVVERHERENPRHRQFKSEIALPAHVSVGSFKANMVCVRLAIVCKSELMS